MTVIPLWGILFLTKLSMKKPQPSSSCASVNQLKRISGQINGIINMIETERSCVEIVDQVLAVRSSISRVGKDLLLNQVKNCSNENELVDLETILKKLFNY